MKSHFSFQILIDEYDTIYGKDVVPAMFSSGEEADSASNANKADDQTCDANKKGNMLFVKGPNAAKASSSSVFIAGGVARNSGKSEF